MFTHDFKIPPKRKQDVSMAKLTTARTSLVSLGSSADRGETFTRQNARRHPPGGGAGCVTKYSIATSTRLDSVARSANSTWSRLKPMSNRVVTERSSGTKGAGGAAGSRCSPTKNQGVNKGEARSGATWEAGSNVFKSTAGWAPEMD